MHARATLQLPDDGDRPRGRARDRRRTATDALSAPPAGGSPASPLRPFGCAVVELAEAAAERRVREAVSALRDGRPVVVVDRLGPTGGVLLSTASATDERTIAFMATYARGLVQLALTTECCDGLGLPAMTRPGGDRRATGMTASISARHGVGTGRSAADRARTVAAVVADGATAHDLTSPGHTFPVRTHATGVRGAARHAEAGVDLARLAGAPAAAVLCVVLDDDGAVMTPDGLAAFATRHGLPSVDIGDVVIHRELTAVGRREPRGTVADDRA